MVSAEEELGLYDERVPLRLELRVDVEQVLGFARQLDEVGRAAGRADGNLVQELAGEDRRIDQLFERHRREGGLDFAGPLGLQRRRELPAGGQAQRGRDAHPRGSRLLRLQEHLVPGKHREPRAGGGASGESARFGGRGDEVELRFDLGGSLRHLDEDPEHVVGVAMPGHPLARSGEDEARDVADGAVRSVLARDPLRIAQRELAGARGDPHARVEDAARRLP